MTPVLACMPRSPEQLLATVLRHDPAVHYLPEDLDNADGDNNPLTGSTETKCNWFDADVCLELGVELPGGPGQRVRARDQVLWLRSPDSTRAGWSKVSYQEARAAAARGQPVIPAWLNNDCRCGHPQGSHDAGGPCTALKLGGSRCPCVHFAFGSSHVGIGIPAVDPEILGPDGLPAPDDGLLWIAQAGRDCFRRGHLTRGFGVRLVDLYAHA